jgi:integrase/recombinase XerD
MKGSSRARVVGPLEPYAEGFRGELARRGYSPFTVVWHLYLMGHLSRWLAGRGLEVSALTSELVDAFVVERRVAGYVNHRSVRGLAPLLAHLRGQGALLPPEPPALSVVEQLLAGYARYLAGERGLAGTTIRRNVDLVRPFVAGLNTGAGVDLDQLGAGEVTAFVVTRCREASGGTAPRMVTALRSLLRFWYVEGFIDRPLADVVPSVATRKLAGIPKALHAEQVTAMLASCDQGTLVGRRDLAILTVLVRLGLRAGEVAGLRLEDIDWRRGEITVRGKGDRWERLPLPADVGQVIVAYLRAGRPATRLAGREVFARVRAPYGRLTGMAVTQIVARAAGRAGLGRLYAHQLRHTAATGMLRAGGSLPEIGQVLRHRHALTTAIYAKVDTDRLRELARPWPVGGAA